MLEGGIGCLRLGQRVTPDGALWFTSACSSPHADRGVPFAVTDQDYAAVIGSIVDDGAVLCTVTGMLTSLPDSLLSCIAGTRARRGSTCASHGSLGHRDEISRRRAHCAPTLLSCSPHRNAGGQ